MTTISAKSKKRSTWMIVSAVLIAAAFLFGFVPQYLKVSGLETDLRNRNGQIELLQARDMAGLLHLELARKNYEIASRYSNSFFNLVRAMMNHSEPPVRDDLEKMLSRRDALTAGIAKADPSSEVLAREFMDILHSDKFR